MKLGLAGKFVRSSAGAYSRNVRPWETLLSAFASPEGVHNTFPEELESDFKLCYTCKNSLDSDKVPMLSRSKGFVYPPKRHGLPASDHISVRLASPRQPVAQPGKRLKK
ncbi:hypothetical protein TNCV_1492401 [Trichonephila clavipes]|nr:hypothetical protein TNCV_1492401 [Trichonephila clavipes]